MCDDDYDDDPCDHDEYDVDVLDGRCRCWRCSESWYASAVEIDAELSRQSAYHEEMERYDRQQWWSDLFWAIRHPFATLHWKLSERGWLRRPVVHDDEIPF